jgi:hypothetical protein
MFLLCCRNCRRGRVRWLPLQVAMSAPGRHVANAGTQQILSTGAIDLFSGLAPADATETLLSMLAVSVANASMDCLMQAAAMSPEYLDGRDLNLRHGFKGAAVAAVLIKVLDARRGNSEPRSVTVRDVKVEAGAQAIIGNVEAPRRNDGFEPRGSSPLAEPEEPEVSGDR